jgi:hypothetical protein
MGSKRWALAAGLFFNSNDIGSDYSAALNYVRLCVPLLLSLDGRPNLTLFDHIGYFLNGLSADFIISMQSYRFSYQRVLVSVL